MPNEKSSNEPSPKTKGEPSTTAPVAPTTPQQAEIGKKRNEYAAGEQGQAKELAREFRTVEIIQIVINGLLGVIGIFALLIYYGQLRQMRKATEKAGISADAAKSAANTAHDALVKSNRPWLGIDGTLTILSPVKVSSIKLNPQQPAQTQIEDSASFTIKNFGKDPAFHVTFYTEIVSTQHAGKVKEYFQDFREATRSSCAMADSTSKPVVPGEEGSGSTIFPNNAIRIPRDPLNTISPTQRTDVSLVVVGCISYRDQFQKTPHHTGFCFTSYSPMSTIAAGQQLGQCLMNEEAD